MYVWYKVTICHDLVALVDTVSTDGLHPAVAALGEHDDIGLHASSSLGMNRPLVYVYVFVCMAHDTHTDEISRRTCCWAACRISGS